MNIRFASFLVALALATTSSVDAMPRVDAGVHRALKDGNVNLMVIMRQSTKPVLESMEEKEFVSRAAMIEDMIASLEAHATSSQQEVEKVLVQETTSGAPLHSGYKTFWIANQVFIENATPELVEKLSKLPSVAEVREEDVIPLEQPVIERLSETEAEELIGHQWGIDRIQAQDVWQDGIFGQNIIVSNIDTGVRYSHEALKKNFRGDYGWYDPELQSDLPYDNNGHGTHTMGTIAGAKGVGVAPGAKWMACKGCRERGCPEADLLACAQFITCPTDTKGQNRDCTKAPHLVSNSWGGKGGRNNYAAAVDAWQKAGIIPVFSNGNSGPECGTVGSPGDYPNVIGVGATNITDGLARFSSRGPAISGLMKPDISAPGVKVLSAWNTSDSAYLAISGTSMACPHVSGAIALLLSADPTLRYEQIKNLLTRTTDQETLTPTGQTCGGITDNMWPNNVYGHGRLNVYSAYQGQRGSPKPPTAPPTPAPSPTTPAPTTPAPTTTAPTPAPKPTPKPNPYCNTFQSEFGCNFWFWCKWDRETKRCNGRFD